MGFYQIKQMLKVITLMSVLLALSGCEAINIIRIMNANSDARPVWQQGTSKAALKTRYIGEKPYVYGRINGQELLFLVDTGASFSMLFDTEKVKQLKLQEGYVLDVAGWGEGKNSRAYQVAIDRLSLGNVYYADIDLAYIPIQTTEYFIRPDEAIFDGVIGHDLMKSFVWTFDKSNNQIAVSAIAHTPDPQAAVLPFHTFLGKIKVDGTADFGNGHQVKRAFIIDTGSRHYLKLSDQYPKANKLNLPGTQVRASDFGLSGQTEHQRFAMPRLSLAGIDINHLKTNLIPADDEDDLWVIGNATLSQFVTTIDYLSEKVYLKPLGQFKSRFNLMGLELRKLQGGGFVVRYVSSALPAGQSDIEVGDVIDSINDKPAADITTDAMLDVLNTPGEHQLCRSRKGSEKCLTLSVTPILGYSVADGGGAL